MPDELIQNNCKLIQARSGPNLNSDMARAMFFDLCSISQRVAIAQFGIVALREDDVSIAVYAFGSELVCQALSARRDSVVVEDGKMKIEEDLCMQIRMETA